MTEELQTADKKSKSLGFVIPVLLVIALISAVGYIITHSGIDKVAVVKGLDSWKAHLQTNGFSKEGSGDFTYDDVEMKGGATSRHAIILNPALTIIPDADFKDSFLNIKSAKVELHPNSVRMNSMKIVLTDPIDVAFSDAGAKTMSGTITSDIPTVVHIKREAEDETFRISSQVDLPAQYNIEAREGDEVESLTIKADSGGFMSGWMLESDQNVGESKAAVKNLVISSAESPEETIQMGAITIDAKSEKAGADAYRVTGLLALADFVLPEELAEYGKISADADFEYTGPLPKDDGAPIDWTGKSVQLNLKNLHLHTADAGVRLHGEFKTLEGEMLPVGTGNIAVKNFAFIRDELRKQSEYPEEENKTIDALLHSITGKKSDEITDLDIPLSREAGQSMKIGKITFEEAFAIMMTRGQISAPEGLPTEPAPVTETPPAETPVDEPAPAPKAAE